MKDKSVLIVDDDEISLLILQNAFEMEGFHVISTTDSTLVNELFDQLKPDVVILDIFMPDKDGFEVIKELKERDKDCSIIAISGNNRYLPAVKALGAITAFPKSTPPDVIVDFVKLL